MSDYAEDRFHRKLDAALGRVGERDEVEAGVAFGRGVCDDRGPRIGEDGTRCRRPKGHTGVHQNSIEDGFGSVISW